MDESAEALAKSRISPERLAQAKALLEDESGYSEAARTIGVDRKTLARAFPGMGMPPRQRGINVAALRKFKAIGL